VNKDSSEDENEDAATQNPVSVDQRDTSTAGHMGRPVTTVVKDAAQRRMDFRTNSPRITP